MEETVKKHFATGTILVAALASFVMMGSPQLVAQEASASTAALLVWKKALYASGIDGRIL
jgi:hypothetical protein